MDGLSIAASIAGIATAGVQVSIKLVSLAAQISTASDRVSSIANDISLTSGVLHQLGELVNGRTEDDGVGILNREGLETTKVSAAMCKRVFQQIEKEVKRASEHLRKHRPGRGTMSGERIELSASEKAKWPFLQPNIDTLRTDLRDAKSTLMLLLQVATLALNKRMADASISMSEHQDFVRAIVALELQRREELTNSTGQQEGLGSGMMDLDCNPRSPSSQAQAGRNYILGTNRSPKDCSDNQARSILDTTVGYEVSRPKGLEPEKIVNVPSANPPTRTDRLSIEDSSDKGSETRTKNYTYLQLFLLEPVVRDFFDKIELHWSMRDTPMDQMAIRKHMAKDEKEGLPSVLEMLQQLHAYEQSLVDTLTSKGSGGSVVYLKRTKTDIRLRDILFKAVPGLHLVVQRDTRPLPLSTLASAGYANPTTHPVVANEQSPRKSRIPSFPFPSKKKARRSVTPKCMVSIPEPYGRAHSKESEEVERRSKESEEVERRSKESEEVGRHSEHAPYLPLEPMHGTPLLRVAEPSGMSTFDDFGDSRSSSRPLAVERQRIRKNIPEQQQQQQKQRKLRVHPMSARRLSYRAAGEPEEHYPTEGLEAFEHASITPEGQTTFVHERGDGDAEAMVTGLLGRYTTLFDA